MGGWGGDVGRWEEGGLGRKGGSVSMPAIEDVPPLFRWYPFLVSIEKEPSFPIYIPLLQPLTTVIPDTATEVATHIYQFIERKKDSNKHWGIVMPLYSKWASKFVDSGAKPVVDALEAEPVVDALQDE